MNTSTAVPVALRWQGDASGHLEILDQTLLPTRLTWLACRDVDTVVEAIRSLRVRGAPAIGIAGAYGVVVAAAEAARDGLAPEAARAHVLARAEQLATARHTAVNLRWAVERTLAAIDGMLGTDATTIRTAALAEARAIHDEDRRLCEAIGRHGAPLGLHRPRQACLQHQRFLFPSKPAGFGGEGIIVFTDDVHLLALFLGRAAA